MVSVAPCTPVRSPVAGRGGTHDTYVVRRQGNDCTIMPWLMPWTVPRAKKENAKSLCDSVVFQFVARSDHARFASRIWRRSRPSRCALICTVRA